MSWLRNFTDVVNKRAVKGCAVSRGAMGVLGRYPGFGSGMGTRTAVKGFVLSVARRRGSRKKAAAC